VRIVEKKTVVGRCLKTFNKLKKDKAESREEINPVKKKVCGSWMKTLSIAKEKNLKEKGP